MIIDKIKSIFKKYNNSYYPCCYILTTKKNKSAFFMHDNLNSFEKQINKNSLNSAKIISVKQGKKLFFRFLKNNSIYRIYLNFVYRNRFDIDHIIKYDFITPFFVFYSKMRTDDDYYEELVKLEAEWIKLLKSINYIND